MRDEIRSFILSQEKPFCMTDIKNRAKAVGITDMGLLYDELDELYKEGLLADTRIHEGSPKWGLKVDA